MSPGPRTTFAKRQKEHARQEKQRAKAERKRQRKIEAEPGAGPPIDFHADQFAVGTVTDEVDESAEESETETH